MDIGEILLSPKGRVGRTPFMAVVAIGWAIAFDLLPFNPLLALRYAATINVAVVVISALAVWVGIAITVKRFHDVGLSGFNTVGLVWATLRGDPLATDAPLTMAIAAFGIIVQLWLCIEPGSRSANRFGNPVSA
jgi:hypothetical protein